MPARSQSGSTSTPAEDVASLETHVAEQKFDFPVGSKHPLVGKIILGHNLEGNCLYVLEEVNPSNLPAAGSNDNLETGDRVPLTTQNLPPNGRENVVNLPKSVEDYLKLAN